MSYSIRLFLALDKCMRPPSAPKRCPDQLQGDTDQASDAKIS